MLPFGSNWEQDPSSAPSLTIDGSSGRHQKGMNCPMKQRDSLLVYVILVCISIPFWIVGSIFPVFLLPGLPLSALMFVAPTMAVIIYLSITGNLSFLNTISNALFEGVFKRTTPSVYWACLVMPLILGVSLLIQYLSGNIGSLEPLRIATVAVLPIVFLIAAIGEETFWSGCLLSAGIVNKRFYYSIWIAIAYVVWHAIPLVQTGNTSQWVVGQILFSFAMRILIIEIYCLFNYHAIVAILMHASYNVAWQLFPNSGSFYNPWSAALCTVLAILAAEITIRKSHQTTINAS